MADPIISLLGTGCEYSFFEKVEIAYRLLGGAGGGQRHLRRLDGKLLEAWKRSRGFLASSPPSPSSSLIPMQSKS